MVKVRITLKGETIAYGVLREFKVTVETDDYRFCRDLYEVIRYCLMRVSDPNMELKEAVEEWV